MNYQLSAEERTLLAEALSGDGKIKRIKGGNTPGGEFVVAGAFDSSKLEARSANKSYINALYGLITKGLVVRDGPSLHLITDSGRKAIGV